MTVDFLTDALSEISDKHIAEAAVYEPKAKRFSFRKIALTAACFIVIAIAAFSVNTFLSKPPVKPDETSGSVIETTKDDTVSEDSTNTTAGTTASSGVPPINYDDWENEDLPWYFLSVAFEGKTYQGGTSSGEPIESNKLLQQLGRISVYDYVKQKKGEYIDLIIYEVEGISKDYAVAVKREDGLMNGAFLYIENRVFYDSQTIGELTDKLKLTDNMTISKVNDKAYFTYYDGSDKDVSYKSIGHNEDRLESIRNSFIALLKNNADCKKYEYNHRDKVPVLCFDISLYGHSIDVEVTSDGYISFDRFRYYKANKKQCNEFISSVFDYSSPHDSELAKEIESCETLGELTGIYSLSVQSSYWTTYQKQGENDIIYSLSVEARNLIDDLILSNSDAGAISRISNCDEKLVFDTAINGDVKPEIYLCDDGYLYVSCEAVTKAFYIGEEKYNAFMDGFKKSACIYNPKEPVTMG